MLSVGPSPRNGHKTDNAHPPIHPVKYTNSLTVSFVVVVVVVYHSFLFIFRVTNNDYMNLL